MKIMFYGYFIFFVISCSTSQKDKSEINFNAKTSKGITVNIDLIATDMASLDSRIRAKLIRKEKIKDLRKINTEFYLQKVEKYKDPSESEYIDYLKAEDIEIVTKGKGSNFVLCTRSRKLQFVLCDKANSAMIDFIGHELSIDLQLKVDALLLN